MGLPQQPTKSPLLPAPPTAFDLACLYRDGTFVVAVTPGPVPVAQPPDGFEVQFLAPQAGHPARVELLPQPRRPVQRHQPADAPVQPVARPPGTRRTFHLSRSSSKV
jgi:hypothetical protein